MKFRVFDKNLKEKMIHLDQHEELTLVFYSDGTWVVVDEGGTIVTSNRGHGGKLMTGTDYKDKNGKEIYRGDIVVFPDGNIGYVVFRDGAFVITEGIHTERIDDYEFEVIGNIYENPELLESDRT